jgi:hypothetical protein
MTMTLVVIKTGRSIRLRDLGTWAPVTIGDWEGGQWRTWMGRVVGKKGGLHTLNICQLRLFPSIYREDGHS